MVATDVGGVSEIIEHGSTGYVVEPDDAVAMSIFVDRLLADRSHASALGEAARARMRNHFGVSRMISETLALYARALEAAPRAGSAASLAPSA